MQMWQMWVPFLLQVPPPIAGIISMATEYHDKPLASVEDTDLKKAIRVKVLCALHLHQAGAPSVCWLKTLAS